MPAAIPPAPSPEPLLLLIESLPAKHLLKFIKNEPTLAYTVLLGFTAREKSLEILQVRQRLVRELEKNAPLGQALFEIWQTHFQPLLDRLNMPDVAVTPDSLLPLRKQYGAATLQYALLHVSREEVRALAEQVAELPSAAPSAKSGHHVAQHPATLSAKSESSVPSQQLADLHTLLQIKEKAREVLQAERDSAQKQLFEARRQLTVQAQQLADAERRLTREQRRVKKAEEEAELLRKALRREQQEAVGTPPAEPLPAITPALLSTIRDAIALLQQGLSASESGTPKETNIPPALPAAAPIEKRPVVKKIPLITVTLPTPHGKEHYTTTRVLAALRHNDVALLEEIRNGIALLGNTPQREAAAVTEFTKAGIPEALLTGPLRPALIDGSNIANMAPEQRAHLAYIQQAQRAAWREGYFPVLIIVDASLRYQIDRPDQLMDMIERGEIEMAPAGTSADALLIEETARRHAVLLTNDRMSDWPAAKELEKRHVELIGGNTCLGGFHRSSLWFR